MADQRPVRLTLLFDGYCGFCTWAAHWLASHDRSGQLRVAPCQSNDLRGPTGVSRRDCEQAAWAVDQSGRHYRGAAALLAGLTLGRDWPFLLSLYRLAPVRWAADAGYRLVARWRSRLPGVTPYCQAHPERCDRSG